MTALNVQKKGAPLSYREMPMFPIHITHERKIKSFLKNLQWQIKDLNLFIFSELADYINILIISVFMSSYNVIKESKAHYY